MTSISLSLFAGGAAALALWIDMRFPKLAPATFSRRVVAACCALLVLQLVPIHVGSTGALYATLFALVLPSFVGTFLTAAWLVRSLRDARMS